MSINIAVDGPAGAGKSSIARAVAEEIGYIYVDTGALYRSIALYSIENKFDNESLVNSLDKINIRLEFIDKCQHVFLNDNDVSDKIRTPEVSMGASKVSVIPEVREFLFGLQKKIAAENNIIMDGRDIGTVVLPDADLKVFLTASAEERANRRFKEMTDSSITYEQVLEDIKQRDYNDMHRDIAPLKQAEDAVLLDTTGMTIEEVKQKLKALIDETEKSIG
ncbi:(d)CMP kinase [Porcipelethomonas ammoniilytica]|uniref:(d)CMP kinase n=1 Tax=Porcipelethomonas ammoniilytica TaxID=2981722 RepID=UPI000823419C|nr:(d)CMP kinase [Porcipelethomonas ammoniilytica]MCU6718802.1 (d)CMP kinase [Porcipelethomonas ammoniilytica]SCI60966.1 Cytidylate kinase [uncultured Ruminococcus sp.]